MDDTLFEFLHSEIVNYVLERQLADSSNKEDDLSDVEYIGFSTGYRIIERLTRELPRFKDELDTMKFICTDFWAAIYKKQIDNLRTNHQGVYVLQDNGFKFLTRLSNSKQYLELAPRYVAFTCGVIRGGLANLGIICIVTAEIQNMPASVQLTKYNIGDEDYFRILRDIINMDVKQIEKLINTLQHQSHQQMETIQQTMFQMQVQHKEM